MQRRNFLFKSGILASAIIASPSAAFSADKRGKIAVLIIQDASGSSSDLINSAINESSGQPVYELINADISELTYSSHGFSVTMNSGKTYLAEKIIFTSYEKVDVSQLIVSIKSGDKNIPLPFDAVNENTIPAPEYWAFTANKFTKGKIKPFFKRKNHAFLCIS